MVYVVEIVNSISINPSYDPTNQPTRTTSNPSYPTIQPSIYPTNEPTYFPTKYPTIQPSMHPSSNPTVQPTKSPTKAPTISQTLDLSALNQNGECDNTAEAIGRHDYISLSECIDLCESVIWENCIMIQYYDKLASNADSRCYIFDQICYLSQDVGKRANTSHIYYKNQFTKQFCVDYRDWTDKWQDDCDAYVIHGKCVDGVITDETSLEEFTEAKDPIYGWTALEACCSCGGGKSVYKNIAVSFLDELSFNDPLQECSFKEDIINTTNLATWNNFALYQLIEAINNYGDFELNKDLIIYANLLQRVQLEYSFIICDFSLFDINITSKEKYTDFFIFAAVEYSKEMVYFINSEYFQLELDILSDSIKIQYHNFRYCNTQIRNASLNGNSNIDMIVQCFYQYVAPTTYPTKAPIITIHTSEYLIEEETVIQKALSFVMERLMMVIIGAGILLCLCITCMICICRRKPALSSRKHSNDSPRGSHHDADDDSNMEDDEESAIMHILDEYIEEGIGPLSAPKKRKKKHRNGTLFYQTRYYDIKQIKNIQQRWQNNIEGGPRLLFGDNYLDNKRSKGTKRMKYGNQSQVLGKIDRTFGFGIITTFENCESKGFVYNDHNFKQLTKHRFETLNKHIVNGGDIVIPYPSKKDLQLRPHKYFNDENEQTVFHNIGTGISPLPFHQIMIIQQYVYILEENADKITKVKQVLYDPNYTDTDSTDSESEEEQMVQINSNGKRGTLYFQTAWYSKKQMSYIRSQIHTKEDIKKAPRFLFGENDEDNDRSPNTKRAHWGGQAAIIGIYDRLFGFGIVTTYYNASLPSLKQYMLFIDKQFKRLQQHLLNGYDVIIPTPSKNNVIQNKKRYCKNGKQLIFHNIGTGIAMLPFKYIAYIQQKIDQLKKIYAGNVKTVEYYGYSPKKMNKKPITKKELIEVVPVKKAKEVKKKKWGKNKGQNSYQCPLCTECVHYLIKLKNCSHSICEPCLRSYICDCLNYVDNDKLYRFKCWAAPLRKCENGMLCLEDIYYAEDRCQCKLCREENTDTGTGTILDEERFQQFNNIMTALNTKSCHDTDKCPKCEKPFPLLSPWRNDDKYEEKMKSMIQYEFCNCCGKNRILMDNINNIINDEEIGSTAYRTYNNCSICNYYYCDECRSNCFYIIEERITIKPPTPVQNAMIKFFTEQTLKEEDYKTNVQYEREHNNNKKHNKSDYYERQKFECCEICWYKHYCRQCPHCEHKFCGKCKGKWDGCTSNWNDKLKLHQHLIIDNDDDDDDADDGDDDDEQKYGGDNVYNLIDEKNGKHNDKSHHSCNKEKLRLTQQRIEAKQSKEQQYETNLHSLQRQKDDEEFKKKQAVHKYNQQKQKNQELANLIKEKDQQNAILQAQLLGFQKQQLEQQKNEALSEAEQQQRERQRIEQEAEEKLNEYNSEIGKYKLIKQENEQKINDMAEETDKLRKKIGFIIKWQYKDDDEWKSYDDNINKKLEKLKIGKSIDYKCDDNNQNYKIKKTGKKKGEQINTKSNKKRQVRRIKEEKQSSVIKYPKHWNMEGISINLEGHTNTKYAKPKVIKLSKGHKMYKEVENNFFKTVSRNSTTIISIESVQNQMLFDSYYHAKKQVLTINGKNKLNEKYLFHGTRTEDVMNKIIVEGFRKEYNSTAAYGYGTYFARDSNYSYIHYASNTNGIRKLFQCKVICGESYVGSGNYTLRLWPKRGGDDGLMYDSLVDNTSNPSIYVIHQNYRAYPMFIITYKNT